MIQSNRAYLTVAAMSVATALAAVAGTVIATRHAHTPTAVPTISSTPTASKAAQARLSAALDEAETGLGGLPAR